MPNFKKNTSSFRMYGKSPITKALVGKQNNLPAELKAKIMAAPESPAKMYGKKSPAKKYKSDAQQYMHRKLIKDHQLKSMVSLQ